MQFWRWRRSEFADPRVCCVAIVNVSAIRETSIGIPLLLLLLLKIERIKNFEFGWLRFGNLIFRENEKENGMLKLKRTKN
jgi:hypothetical protein